MMNVAIDRSQIIKPPKLGLVCITASKAVRFRTVTRKRLLQFSLAEQEQLLRNLYRDNLDRLRLAINFCASEGIQLYRLSSALFPFADDALGAAVLSEFADTMQQVGQLAHDQAIRLVLHPDQFVVLNSDRPEVIENSIKILAAHARSFDLLGLPQSSWALMNIHGGKGDRVDRLVSVIRNLPDNIRSRLTLENDEHAYSARQILEICHAAEIPMVFDAHHHVIHEQLETYEDPTVAEMVTAARSTWTVPDWQLVHISNGNESFLDPRHSDFITLMPSSYWQVSWIEVEAKQKELAIAKLRKEWLSNPANLAA
ncbi:UV DNA damage repair endonuclease UvsE [Thermocoleostomius sinensis A174]|uniref:UV DNA damage repair endonuclease UvsE n=2 Tax=Thermocoleostomius TaxID=3065395 RepID=A0A9E8ZD38_9CYAN|nr:UV DNA damage repair endonuclease UvsE [Thermocoleostomius sinensis]WAL60712.1 UV DNA damage repair endonuclease UvsE [Thermocoleostomius sinensis A174]